MEKLYFKLDQKFEIVAYILCYILLLVGIVFLAMSNDTQRFMIIICILILLLVIFNHIVFEINGFRIKNNK